MKHFLHFLRLLTVGVDDIHFYTGFKYKIKLMVSVPAVDKINTEG